MTELYPTDPSTSYCYIRQPLIGLDPNAPAYINALRETLNRIKSALTTTTNTKALSSKLKSWIETLLSTTPDLDTGIRTVLGHTMKTLPPS
ncbi:hypothetical protein NPX13_g10283 [Xylaria arbuscula]|uniref:Uncharacterized protein n=1 Tax=Xylaria arbuscula TaxID=114810 RepID=A0A9W8N538_9PEZI|nr:hypothetical protein NPX13_g10283 [Xylaria arbuscula]